MRDSAKRRRLSVWVAGDGIEIGALHNPLTVPATARVRYVDRMPEAELRKHYPELNAEMFAPVSIIGSAEDLSMLGDASVDFVIANHLLEHVEDPVAALKEFERVLRQRGVLYLALPDMRRTFDRDRDLTTVDHLIEEHRTGSAANRSRHYLDWALHVDKKDEDHAQALMDSGYSIHFHVWCADTFLDFLVRARQEFALDFEIAQFAGPETDDDDEFILILAKGRADTVPLPRGEIGPDPPVGAGAPPEIPPISDAEPAASPVARRRGVVAKVRAFLGGC